MKRLPIVLAALVASELLWAPATFAQSVPESRWNVEFGIGWDNSISGNINSSAFGRINNLPVVITKNTYEDVYGTGLYMRFGGGYMLNEASEVRAIFTLQSLDADLTTMGEIGAANLYATIRERRRSPKVLPSTSGDLRIRSQPTWRSGIRTARA